MHLRKVIMYWKGSAPETLGCDTSSFKYYIPPIHAIEEYTFNTMPDILCLKKVVKFLPGMDSPHVSPFSLWMKLEEQCLEHWVQGYGFSPC